MHFFNASQGIPMTTPMSSVTDEETGVQQGSDTLPKVTKAAGSRQQSQAPTSPSDYRAG